MYKNVQSWVIIVNDYASHGHSRSHALSSSSFIDTP